jgi:hypothetical protein
MMLIDRAVAAYQEGAKFEASPSRSTSIGWVRI